MSTKIITVSATPPAESSGSDYNKAAPLNAIEFDQNIVNLRAAVDRALLALGGFAASQTPAANQIPVVKSDSSIAFPGNVTSAGKLKVSDAGSGTVPGLKIYSETMGFSSPTGTELAVIVGGATSAMIDASGNLLVGVASGNKHTLYKSLTADYTLQVTNAVAASCGGIKITLSGVSNDSASTFFACSDNSAVRFNIAGNGNVTNTNNSYGAISDIKLKNIIGPARSYWDDYKRLEWVNYTLKADSTGTKLLGGVAQQFETVFPGLVEETNDTAERQKTIDGVPQYEQGEITPAVMDGELVISPAVYGDNPDRPIMERYETGETTKNIKYSVATVIAECVLQEAQQRIESLEQENAAQRTLIEDLVSRVTAMEVSNP